jgi:hypothetical protein
MVKSLHRANAPEPQIAAISEGFDRIASDVHSIATELFSFASVALVVVFLAWRRALAST